MREIDTKTETEVMAETDMIRGTAATVTEKEVIGFAATVEKENATDAGMVTDDRVLECARSFVNRYICIKQSFYIPYQY